MPRGAERFFSRRTREERVRERRHVILEDVAISKNTRKLYIQGARRLLPIFDQSRDEQELDDRISQWVQKQWSKGTPLFQVSSALCGVQHFLPWTKRRLSRSWRSYQVWRRLEVPIRAPPLAEDILLSLANFAIQRGDLIFASLLLLGFYALLRTGELLQVCPRDILLKDGHGLVRLQDTKTSRKKGTCEIVPIDHLWTRLVLEQVLIERKAELRMNCPIWLESGQSFRQRFAAYFHYFNMSHCQYRPYSLRRGGATHFFLTTGSYDLALDRGRWQSTRVAKLYIQDGLAQLPILTLPKADRSRLLSFYPTDL